MAHIKQQIKRIKTDEKRRQRNASTKSGMKTALKRVISLVEDNDKEKAVEAYVVACKQLDKAQIKGVVHKNFVARNKSRLQIMINNMN